MTALNFTMGQGFAVISQDRRTILTRRRDGQARTEKLDHKKLYADPGRGVVSGVRGDLAFALMWHRPFPALDIDAADFEEAAPRLSMLLSVLSKQAGGQLGRQQVVAGGLSRRERPPMAWFFDSTEGFEAVPLTIGHTICPEPAWDAASGGRVRELWMAAFETPGAALEFHAALGANQAAQAETGAWGSDVTIGGGIDAAAVIRHGSITLHCFDEGRWSDAG